MGALLNSDEYVPTATPIIRAKAKPRITSPPKRKMMSNTAMVVPEVLNVRESVAFRELFTFVFSGRWGTV